MRPPLRRTERSFPALVRRKRAFELPLLGSREERPGRNAEARPQGVFPEDVAMVTMKMTNSDPDTVAPVPVGLDLGCFGPRLVGRTAKLVYRKV